MKLKALVALIALALAGASLAYAAPKAANTKPPKPNPKAATHTSTNSKKPPKTGPGCKPRVVVILKGTFTGTLGTDGTGNYFVVHVTGGNHFAKAYKYNASTHAVDTNVYYDSSTKYKGPGHHALGDLKTGDRLVVRAPVCKADVVSVPNLFAKRVLAHTPKSNS